MSEELNKILADKKKGDRKQRQITLVITFISLLLIGTVIYYVTKAKVTNEKLSSDLVKTELIILNKDSVIKDHLANDSDFIARKKDSLIKKITDSVIKTSNNKAIPNKKLYDSLNTEIKKLSAALKMNNGNGLIECLGKPTGTYSSSGLPMYNFVMRISKAGISEKLSRVEYLFDHSSYNPRLKPSKSSKTNFSIEIRNSWGCLDIVTVYLYFKNNQVDTIAFPMCDKAKIDLPKF
jgi:hypothetical protein